MNDRLLSLLGLCRRAGRLVIGAEKTREALQRRAVSLVLVASDVAPRTEKEMRHFSGSACPVVRIPQTGRQLSQAIGAPAGTVSVADAGFAKQAMLLIK